jgi:hypothetical protein
MLAAGRPLLDAARDAHQIDPELDLDQVLDLVVAIAEDPRDPGIPRADPRHGARRTARTLARRHAFG